MKGFLDFKEKVHKKVIAAAVPVSAAGAGELSRGRAAGLAGPEPRVTDTRTAWRAAEPGLRCQLKPDVQLVARTHHSNCFILVLAETQALLLCLPYFLNDLP